MTALIAVVGSANLDVVLSVARRPAAGETVMGSGYLETAGGKGANQATAAARIASCAFIGSVGHDSAGRRIATALREAGVAIDHLHRGEMPTGRAFISLTPDGENSIVVLPLANSDLRPSDVVRSLDASRPAVVLTQLEVPTAVTAAVVEWCTRNDARLVLNPSPVQHLPSAVLAIADPLIANAGEARALVDLASDTPVTDATLAAALALRCRSAVLTAGPRGAFVAADDSIHHIEGLPVTVADTTGAGDAFAGTVAAHLALGAELVAAASIANREAARVIQLNRTDR
ncbi:MAG: rbsK 1 [Rhodoglobus sp.]|nr:rbsK 1 [Rhodoglobus sp.]